MTTMRPYSEIAQAYAAGVRALLAPVPAAAGERGARDLPSAAALADRAAELLPTAGELRQATAAQVTDVDPATRAEASTRLLAQALTDLQISAYLLQAAEDEEMGGKGARDIAAERSISSLPDIEENLAVLLGDQRPRAIQERGVTVLTDLPAARTRLSQSVEDTLTLIEKRAATTSQAAVLGLAAMGLTQVAAAAGVVGLDIAQALGVAEKVTRLYNLVREFALSAYNSVLSLLGPAVAQTAAQQVLQWVSDVVQGEQFAQMLGKLYGTAETEQRLKALIEASQAALEKFARAIEGVEALNAGFARQLGLIDRGLQLLKMFSGAAAAALPQVTVLLAAAHLLLAGYTVFAGADYLDAQRLRILNRVPGVPSVVEANLGHA